LKEEMFYRRLRLREFLLPRLFDGASLDSDDDSRPKQWQTPGLFPTHLGKVFSASRKSSINLRRQRQHAVNPFTFPSRG
jgi:hypothetical protein